MTTQRSSRSKQLLGLAQMGMTSLIKTPVREAVREALAEERHLTKDHAKQPRQSDDSEQSESGGGLLKPTVILSALGLAAAVAVMKRKRLLQAADETGMVDGSDETDSGPGVQTKATADLNSAGVGDSTGYDADAGATDRADPTGRGEHGADTDGDDFSMTE